MVQSFPELTKPSNRNKPVKHDVVHEIETNGYPRHARARPFSPKTFQEEIDFMLKAGYITRSSSEYSSPIHLVPKKETGKFRLARDYRVLNQQTIPDRYPTPSVQNLLHRLTGSRIFSKIDLVRPTIKFRCLIPLARKLL